MEMEPQDPWFEERIRQNEERDTRNRELGEELAELFSHITAATFRFLELLRDFDQREGWSGWPSCAHWLNWRLGISLATARERLRVAKALAHLPKVSEAMRRGRISYSKVRAITRVATPEDEGELLYHALSLPAAQTETLVRKLRRTLRSQEELEELSESLYERRRLDVFTDEDGSVEIRARLDPETGAVFRKALEAAGDKLFEDGRNSEEVEPSPCQRRADALGLIAESALAADLDPGTRADRYQVVLHVEPEGNGLLSKEHDISAEASKRFCCDSSRVTITQARDGTVLDVGRRTRSISPGMRRALEARDGHCQFPGCSCRFFEAHHVKHWAEGGETRLDNLVLLCRRHHRLVHEGGYSVEPVQGEAVRWRFRRSDGTVLESAGVLPSQRGCGAKGLARRHREEGIEIDHRELKSDWDGRPIEWRFLYEGAGRSPTG